MRRFLLAGALAALGAVGLTGCITVVVNTETESHHHHRTPLPEGAEVTTVEESTSVGLATPWRVWAEIQAE